MLYYPQHRSVKKHFLNGGSNHMKQIKGVNLGNWLVLEKWMDERFFEGTGAEDEVWLVRKTAPEVLAGKMKQRRFREVSRLQLDAWSVSAGHIFWNYQLWRDQSLRMDAEWKESWDLSRCWKNGWIPKKL